MTVILDEISEIIPDARGELSEELDLRDAIKGFVRGLDPTRRNLFLMRYFYMASIKDEVTSVTVVERSKDAIALFKEHILPQFPDPKKVTVLCSDAFEFAENKMARGEYDTVFTDLWHDPSDGVELYLKMKEYENKLPNAQFVYWIEKTLKLYM